MIESFISHLSETFFISQKDKILLAVSGGADSMVMLDLFLKSGIPVAVAHINHNLRHEESEADEEMVRTFCRNHQLRYHHHTIEKGTLQGGNLQENARNIRYTFLYSLAAEFQYSKIATAHHKDDNIETMLMHMMSGTGLQGLKGMPEETGLLIRPMLIFDHKSIRKYAEDNHILFREDSSNRSGKYLRNKIRHDILPLMYQSDVRAAKGLYKTQKNIAGSYHLYLELIRHLGKTIVYHVHHHTVIRLSQIREFDNSVLLLFELISSFGFHQHQASDMLSKEKVHNNRFFSSHFQAVTDRDELWISPIKKDLQVSDLSVTLSEWPSIIRSAEKTYDVLKKNIGDIAHFEKSTLYLDVEKLPVSIIFRTKRPGDIIKPLGLDGRTKKLKDYLSDKKVPLIDRDTTLVFASEDNIYAVIPWGISEDVKIDQNSRFVLEISESSQKSPV